MKALVTGASSGIGRDMARYLSGLGYDIIAVARDGVHLSKLKEELKTNVETISIDLADTDACKQLYELVKNKNIDVLINNAGFGDFGEFTNTDLDKELNMIDVNIKAMHILAKLFLQDMVKRNNGYILNVASIAGFMPGPLMATYYSTKAYIVRLTQSLYTELKKKKSKRKKLRKNESAINQARAYKRVRRRRNECSYCKVVKRECPMSGDWNRIRKQRG